MTLAQLAQQLGGTVRGDASVALTRVATLETAGPRDLAFVASDKHNKYSAALAQTRAGAVIVGPDTAAAFSGTAWVSDNPRLLFARAAALIHPATTITGGRHPSAVVDSSAQIAASAHVGACVVIAAGARIGANVYVGAGCVIGRNVSIGDDSYLAARVTLLDDTVVGMRCIFQAGAVIGADGFGYARDGARWIKVPQLGRVVLGDDVEIGANTTVDRGALGDTVIGNGVKLDNLIQVGHNVHIGDDSAMAACGAIAGSVKIGKRCTFAGRVGITGHLDIADDVHVAATSMVTQSIPERGAIYSGGLVAMPASEWRKNMARFRHLDDLARRLKAMEQKIQQLFKREHP